MGRLFTSGFEQNTNTAGVEFTSVNGAPTIQTGTFRSGARAGQITSLASGVEKSWVYQFAAADSSADFYFRFYFNISVLPNVGNVIAALFDSTANNACNLQLDTAGNLGIHDNSGGVIGSTTLLATGTHWYDIELVQGNTSGKVELKVDGVVIATTGAGTTAVIRDLRIGGNISSGTATAGTWFFDDIAINDTSGSVQNGYPGAGSVTVLRPNAAGDNNTFATQTGGTAGAANNFSRVNEFPPNDATSFNGSVILNQVDDLNIDDTPGSIGASDTITLVQLNVRYRASVASAVAIYKTRIKKAAAGTVALSAAITPNATAFKTNTNAVPNLPPQTLYLDPDGAAWTKATLDTAQIGYIITTTGTNRADISAIWLTVESIPAVAVVYPSQYRRTRVEAPNNRKSIIVMY